MCYLHRKERYFTVYNIDLGKQNACGHYTLHVSSAVLCEQTGVTLDTQNFDPRGCHELGSAKGTRRSASVDTDPMFTCVHKPRFVGGAVYLSIIWWMLSYVRWQRDTASWSDNIKLRVKGQLLLQVVAFSFIDTFSLLSRKKKNAYKKYLLQT
jgi:hypothetical protein